MADNTHTSYDGEVQKVLLSFMISDPTSFAISQSIIKPDYFDSNLRGAVRAIMDYADAYKVLPTPEQIKAKSGLQVDRFSDVAPQHSKWYLETIEGFCQYKALELVILDAMDLLNKGEGAEVEKRVKETRTISLMRDLGLSYWDKPVERLERIKDTSDFVSTGWKALDFKLGGGFTKGALNVFAGGSGSGKSLILANLALNWTLEGKNVVYISLELSEDLVAMRFDAMTSGISTKEILTKINDVGYAVKQKSKGAGDLRIKKMPEAGTTANTIRSYLKEYEIQTGRRPDVLIVDYLDLMHPNNARLDISNLFTKDKYTSEELRALAGEWDVVLVTASQLNRQAIDAGGELDHSHIAGGLSKINTADNVIAIITNPTMRESGLYEFLFLKTRSAAAVGQKIKLKYEPHCLRIRDAEDDGSEIVRPKSNSEIQADLRAKLGTKVMTNTSAQHFEPVEVKEGESMRAKMMELMHRARGDRG